MFNRDRKGANQLEHWQVGEPVDLSHEIKRKGVKNRGRECARQDLKK